MSALLSTTVESALRILLHIRNVHDAARRLEVRSLIRADIAMLRAARKVVA